MAYKLNIESILINNKRKFVFNFFDHDALICSKYFAYESLDVLKKEYFDFIKERNYEVKKNVTITFNSDNIFFDTCHLPSNAINKHKIVIENNLNDFFSVEYKTLTKVFSKKYKLSKKYIGVTRLLKIEEYYDTINVIKSLGLIPIAFNFKDECVANSLTLKEKVPLVYIYEKENLLLSLYIFNDKILYSRVFDLTKENVFKELKNSILAYQNKLYKLTLDCDIAKIVIDGKTEIFNELSKFELPFGLMTNKIDSINYKKNLRWILPTFDFGFTKNSKKEVEQKDSTNSKKSSSKVDKKPKKKQSFWTMDISFKKKAKDENSNRIKKGFTLTEVIVSSVLFALTAAAITSTVLVFNNAFHKNVNSLLLNHTVDEIATKMKHEQDYLERFTNVLEGNKVYYFNPNNTDLSDKNLNHQFTLKLDVQAANFTDNDLTSYKVVMTEIKDINNSNITTEDISFNVIY